MEKSNLSSSPNHPCELHGSWFCGEMKMKYFATVLFDEICRPLKPVLLILKEAIEKMGG